MPQTAPVPPLAYHPEKRKVEITHQLTETLPDISETTCKDAGQALRSAHAKSHGLLQKELTVLDGLPATLAQGLHAKPGRYPVVLRFSTNPGDILDDSISVPRDLALKVVGVESGRSPGSEGQATQDHGLVNGPASATPTAKKSLGSLKLLAKTTDAPQALRKIVFRLERGAVVLPCRPWPLPDPRATDSGRLPG